MLKDRELIDAIKLMDFEMMLDVADSIEATIEKDGADTLSEELVKYDIALNIAIKERMDELIECERRVKEILCNC